MSDERVLTHLVAARRAGDREQALLCLRILAFANLDRVTGWVALKVPREDVDEVASQVLESAIAGALRSPFEGEQVGQFRAWLHAIARFRIADYHRARERSLDAEPLPGEHEAGGRFRSGEPSTPDATDGIFAHDLIEEALGELSEVHRLCVELGGPSLLGFEGLPAREAAATLNDQLHLSGNDSINDVNVHKILSRFRDRCRRLFEEGGLDG